MERSARSMVYQRRYENLNRISGGEYRKLSDSITHFKKDVMQGKRTVDEYEEFLKTFFTRKYKWKGALSLWLVMMCFLFGEF